MKDSFLRSGSADRNEGANPGLRIQASGNNRVVVGFDPAAIDAFLDANTLTAATLVLTIAENADNWGPNNDRTVDAHPLGVDFAEGNGQNAGVPGAQSTRGSGPGVTWNCAIDAEIANQATDCDPRWDGGTFGPATAASVPHVNGLSGEVSWDVTDDVLAGATAWLIKKTAERQAGQVSYFSKEGSASDGPRLILEGQPSPPPTSCVCDSFEGPGGTRGGAILAQLCPNRSLAPDVVFTDTGQLFGAVGVDRRYDVFEVGPGQFNCRLQDVPGLISFHFLVAAQAGSCRVHLRVSCGQPSPSALE